MTIRPFFDTLREIRRGQILDDCAVELQKVVSAVDATGKPGKLIIELTIKPASKGHGVFAVADKVRTKLPDMSIGETILFGTVGGNLQARNPSQPELDLRDASAKDKGDDAPLKQLASSTATTG